LTQVQAYDLDGNPTDRVPLPRLFETPIRPDVIKKAVLTQQSHRYQPQGRDPMAGKRTSAESLGTGLGIARMARVKGSQHPKARQAAFVPSAVGGRRTHPPSAEKWPFAQLSLPHHGRALWRRGDTSWKRFPVFL